MTIDDRFNLLCSPQFLQLWINFGICHIGSLFCSLAFTNKDIRLCDGILFIRLLFLFYYSYILSISASTFMCIFTVYFSKQAHFILTFVFSDYLALTTRKTSRQTHTYMHRHGVIIKSIEPLQLLKVGKIYDREDHNYNNPTA